MSQRYSLTHGLDDSSRYNDSIQQSGFAEILLGHDAKERIKSTLKALGIYNGDGQDNAPGQQASGQPGMLHWDPPKTSSEKVDRHPARWTSQEENPAHDVRDVDMRGHGSDYNTQRGDDLHQWSEPSTFHGSQNYEPNNQFNNSNDTGSNLQYNENMGNAPYGQEQHSWSGGSYTQNEPSFGNPEGNFDLSGGSNTGPSNAWHSPQSFNCPSSYTPSSNQNPVSAAVFSQPLQNDDPGQGPFNEPFRSEACSSADDSIKGGNLGGANSTPRQSHPLGLFDIAKKASYVNPSPANLKPLVKSTISNPPGLTSQRGNVHQSKRKPNLSEEEKDATYLKLHQKSVYMKLLAEREKKKRRLILPEEEDLKRYKNYPNCVFLIGKIMKGSRFHQMEIFQALGVKINLQHKQMLPWKCYICRKATKYWQHYVTHCTARAHKRIMDRLLSTAVARENMRQQLMDLPDECVLEEPSSSAEVPEKEETIIMNHPCGACGSIYSEAEDLQRHLESEEHKQRVLFLMDCFGDNWKQFQVYNQTSQAQNTNPEEPVGVAFVEKREEEKNELQERENVRLEQEKQIQEESKRLEEAQAQLERTRQLQDQREKEFKDNQMQERAKLDKRILKEQMQERELMDQQLRYQESVEQNELENSIRQKQTSGERMTDRQRRKLERKMTELEKQQMREREFREAKLRKHQEAEHQRSQEEQLKEQELQHREMLEGINRETGTREVEQIRDRQDEELGEQELRTERLLQVNLEEQDTRDRTIREQGCHEWQRREEDIRVDGVLDREIPERRDMFERGIEATIMNDAEMRTQQFGEVLNNPQKEGDLREKVIQQKQLRERREVLLQELRQKAIWELERKEMDLRRGRFTEREIEEILTQERQIYESKILEELRVRGLAEGPSWEGPGGDVNPIAIDAQNVTRERSRDRTPDEQEIDSSRESDWSEADEQRARESDSRDNYYWTRDDDKHAKLNRRREEDEFQMRRSAEEEMIQRQHRESRRAMRSEDGDIVVHEMGGLRNVHIVGKKRLPPGDLREKLREREKYHRRRSSDVEDRRAGRSTRSEGSRNKRRDERSTRPERSGNKRDRVRRWRESSRESR